MPTDIKLVFGAWTSRFVFPVAICIVLKVLKKEYNKRQIYKETETDQYQKCLNVWSLLTIIMSMVTCVSFAVHKIPFLCRFNYGLFQACWVLLQCTFTFYQIARLQFCFSARRVHSTKYGFSNKTFIILYVNGVSYVIYTLVIPWFAYNIHDLGVYGCKISNSSLYNILILVGTVWFYIWDWTVLSMYIYKICQMKKHKIFDDVAVYKRVRYITTKIILLTVIYEIKAVFIVLLNTFVWGNFNIFSILIPICIVVDILSTVFIICLMMEHNDNDFLKIVRKYRVCCRLFIIVDEQPKIQKQITNNQEQKANNFNKDEDTLFETRKISQTIQPIALSICSEITQTIELNVSLSK
eukprot:188684_1